MELILWRHADAEPAAPGQADEDRALTAKGRKQAQKMGAWLNRNLPDDCMVLASPALRTRQTAEALGRKFKTSPALATDTTPEEVLRAAHWPDGREPVLVVGHQPTLGQIASLLIGGQIQDWTIRKGSLCWIEQRPDATYIKVLIGPDLVEK
ncbi:MAG TPA: histidine phosphatase family protein [Noviherbaspirillum sp.]